MRRIILGVVIGAILGALLMALGIMHNAEISGRAGEYTVTIWGQSYDYE